MSAPRPTLTPSRLNVGEYGVTLGRPAVHTGWGVAWGVSQFKPAQRLASGTVTPDGSLTVTPEAWRARHYRRAVMGGAGVYRLGLWAYLGARRGQSFTGPEAGATVEPHRVTMRVVRRAPPGMVRRYPWAADPAVTLASTVRGTAGRDGLTVNPEAWRARHYRRAVMRGAGVYQAGLWAMLAHRPQTDAQAEGGAALGGDDGGALERFALDPKHLRVLESICLPGSLGELTFRQLEEQYGKEVSQAVAAVAIRSGFDLVNRSELRQKLLDAFSGQDVETSHRQLLGRLTPRAQTKVSEALNVQAGQLKERAQRRAFRRAAREVLRLLRRMAARRVPQRPRISTPRPLYSRAIPPTAPLAPPAL